MLEQVAYLAEILGVVGIIFSLIFVGRQLQQTNTLARSGVHRAYSDEFLNWTMSIASSPSLSAATAKLHFQDLVRDNASDVERIQISYTLAGLLMQMQLAYDQHKEGLYTHRELEERFVPATGLLTKPYLPSIWPYIKPALRPDFANWLEDKYVVVNNQQSAASTS